MKSPKRVEAALATDGFEINGDKTHCICSSADQGTIQVKGKEVVVGGPEVKIKVLGANFFSLGGGVPVLIASMQQKARAVWQAKKHVFWVGGSSSEVLALLDTLVRPAALWGCSTWPTHAAILQAANTLQLRFLRHSKNPKRKVGETWAQWNQRTLRSARSRLFHVGGQRWYTFILSQIWSLHGHLARSPSNARFLMWRDLQWWETEKSKPRGARHSNRFNPNLDVERGMVKAAGLGWKKGQRTDASGGSLSASMSTRMSPTAGATQHPQPLSWQTLNYSSSTMHLPQRMNVDT